MKLPHHILLFCLLHRTLARPSENETTRCTIDYQSVAYQTIYTSIEEEYGTIHHKLGSGASGTVYLLDRHSDHTQAAIKIFEPFSPALTESRRQQLANYIKLEYHIGSQLNGHSGIAETLELLYEEPTDRWALVSAYYPNTLADVLDHATASEICSLYENIAKTVGYIHSKGFSHGDLKAENILISEGNIPQIIDWGAATFSGCQVETPGTETNVVPGDTGTPAYMPPEVWATLEYDRVKADTWSLGVLFHFMMTGRVPWSTAAMDNDAFTRYAGWQRREDRISLRYPQCDIGGMRLQEGLPEVFAATIVDLLEVDPQDRPTLASPLSEYA